MKPEDRENILGVGVNLVNMQLALGILEEWVRTGERQYVCLATAHSLLDCQDDPEIRTILNQSGLTTPDGMALVWILRMRGHREVSRVYGPDLMLEACRHFCADGLGHYFLGGDPGVPEDLAERLSGQIPGLNIVGVKSPPFRDLTAEEDHRLVEEINGSAPDFLWVALGSPKQERWMADHRQAIDAPVMIAVGAAFDFLSGRKPQAPAWIRGIGMEWLFRLMSEPRRLWPRYRRYPKFVMLALAQLGGLKKYSL